MFGKKKKLEAERREEELRLQKQELERQQAQAAQQVQQQDDKIFFESELILLFEKRNFICERNRNAMWRATFRKMQNASSTSTVKE